MGPSLPKTRASELGRRESRQAGTGGPSLRSERKAREANAGDLPVVNVGSAALAVVDV